MNNTMNRALSRNVRLVLTGAFSALIIVLTFTNLGFISFSPVVSITILQIPVILAAMMAGLPGGLFAGTVMGLMSLIKAAMAPTGILDPLFVNPLCSVLPRMLLGVVAWGIWKFFGMLEKLPFVKSGVQPVFAGITAFAATFCHTLLVYGCIFIFEGADMNAALETIGMTGAGFITVVGVGIVSEIVEAAAACVVIAAVYTGLVIAANSKSKLSKEMEK